MKVFLSWSGELSKTVANVFRDWIPNVIQSIIPYLSAEDIEKGARWSASIAKELEGSNYGIILVTKDNMNAPWINFEAGALSKSIDKAHVTPFLFDLKNSELQGPLTQFQSTLNEKEDISRLIKSINNCLPDGQRLKDYQIEKSFAVWYSHLHNALQEIVKTSADTSGEAKKSHKSQSEVLEEVVELVRTQQRMLSQQSETISNVIEKTQISMHHTMENLTEEMRTITRRLEQGRVPNPLLKRIPDLHRLIIELEGYVEKAQVDGKVDSAETLKQINSIHNFAHLAANHYDDLELQDRMDRDKLYRQLVSRKKNEKNDSSV